LSQRDVSSEQRLFEMRDLEGDRVVWQSQHPTASMPGLIDNKEVGILEPSGTFSILKLDSGKTLFTTELPAKRPQKGAGVLAVQRWKDRYLVVAGVNMKNSNQRNVAPLNIGAPNFGGQRDFAPARELGSSSIASFTVDGFVCSVNATDGTLQWSERVSDLAYDTAQPSSLPVLVLASWQADVDRFGGLPMPSRLSVLILDKRTGNKVYEKQEPNHAIGRGVQFNPMIDDRKLVIDFYNWQLNLTFEPK
jgi:outer membrane protein assembly factor BamB